MYKRGTLANLQLLMSKKSTESLFLRREIGITIIMLRDFFFCCSDTRYPGAVLLSAHVFDSDNYIERLREHPLELSFVPIDPITVSFSRFLMLCLQMYVYLG